MEDRLLPVNGVLTMLERGNIDSAPLASLGFELAGLEIPVPSAVGTVKIDVVLFRQEDRSILAIEAKSGHNIENPQALRYKELAADSVIRAAGITLRTQGSRSLHCIYSVLDENAGRIRSQLRALSFDTALVGVTRRMIRIEMPEDVKAAGTHPLASIAGVAPLKGGILRVLNLDHESPSDVIRDAVVAEVVATMSHPRRTHVSIRTLTERICPQSILFGRAAREALRRRVDEICRTLPLELGGRVEYLQRSEGREDAAVHIVDSPEHLDPRGRTQAYQAIGRARQRSRSSVPVAPGQGELDLFEELDRAGEIGDDVDGRAPGADVRGPDVTLGNRKIDEVERGDGS